MKLTRNINLHGVVLTIDEDAYQLLKDYLSDIESRLPADEQKDVMDDVESRIAELLQSALFAQKGQSVTIDMVRDVRTRIGEPDEFGENKRPAIKREPKITRQGVGRVLTIVLKAILIIIAVQLFFPVLAVVFGLLVAFFGISIGGIAVIPALGLELFDGSTAWTWLLCLSVAVAVCMPIFMIVYWIVKYSREHRHPSLRFWLISLLVWVLSLCGLVASADKALKVNNTDWATVMEYLDEIDDDASIVNEVREVDAFHAIELSGAMKAEIHVGQPQEVKVRFDRLGEVETTVEDGVLRVLGKGNHGGRAVISVPTLDALSLSGASKIDIDGDVDSLRLDAVGASKIDAEELTVKDLHLNVSGASKAEVYVTGTLWAQAAGASKITYHGNPEVLQSLAVGASRIKRD